MERVYNLLYRLRFIKRWETSFCLLQEDVVQHSYSVAVVSHMLCMIINSKSIEKIDIEKAILYALYHDISEVYTMHIVSPIESKLNSQYHLCEHISDEYCKRIIHSLPKEYQEGFSKILFHEERIDEIIREAEIIDAYCKCFFEVSTGNHDFDMKYELYKTKVKQLCNDKDYIRIFINDFMDLKHLELVY